MEVTPPLQTVETFHIYARRKNGSFSHKIAATFELVKQVDKELYCAREPQTQKLLHDFLHLRLKTWWESPQDAKDATVGIFYAQCEELGLRAYKLIEHALNNFNDL